MKVPAERESATSIISLPCPAWSVIDPGNKNLSTFMCIIFNYTFKIHSVRSCYLIFHEKQVQPWIMKRKQKFPGLSWEPNQDEIPGWDAIITDKTKIVSDMITYQINKQYFSSYYVWTYQLVLWCSCHVVSTFYRWLLCLRLHGSCQDSN